MQLPPLPQIPDKIAYIIIVHYSKTVTPQTLNIQINPKKKLTLLDNTLQVTMTFSKISTAKLGCPLSILGLKISKTKYTLIKGMHTIYVYMQSNKKFNKNKERYAEERHKPRYIYYI